MGVNVGDTWRIRRTRLCGGCDARCSDHYCSKLFHVSDVYEITPLGRSPVGASDVTRLRPPTMHHFITRRTCPVHSTSVRQASPPRTSGSDYRDDGDCACATYFTSVIGDERLTTVSRSLSVDATLSESGPKPSRVVIAQSADFIRGSKTVSAITKVWQLLRPPDIDHLC